MTHSEALVTDIRNLASALQKPTSLAERISPVAATTVSSSQLQPLQSLAAQLQSASQTGAIVLFTGTDTAAKAAAAQTLANDLNRSLIQVDANAVAERYTSGAASVTQLLGTPENSGAILFFDEADALFGKRSSVQDSHNRYAGPLQQILEQHTGIIILAVTSTDGWNPAWIAQAHATLKFPPG